MSSSPLPLSFPSLDPNILLDPIEPQVDLEPEPEEQVPSVQSVAPYVPVLASSSRCPLCLYKRKRFVCVPCVKQGNFFHSNPAVRPEFADEKLERWGKAKREVGEARKTILSTYSPKTRLAEVREQIELTKSRLKSLTKSVKEKQNIGKAIKLKLERTTAENLKRRRRLPDFERQARGIRDANKNHHRDLAVNQTQTEEKISLLADARRRRIGEFLTIFPISDVLTPEEQLKRSRAEANPFEIEMMDNLGEAIDMSFVGGLWVDMKESVSYGGHQIQIVGSNLPKNGDYSAMFKARHLAMEKSRNSKQEREKQDEYVAHSAYHALSSGLLHTTQLLHHLLSVLDVHLPRRCSLPRPTDWMAENTEYKFQRMAARLNMGVLYLAVSQGVKPVMRTRQTLYNVKGLLEEENELFGRPFRPVPHIDFLHDRGIEEQANLISIPRSRSDASDDEDEEELLGAAHGDLERGWAAISEEELDFIPDVMHVIRSPSPAPVPVSSSVLTSVTSLLWGIGGGGTSPGPSPKK